MTTLSIALTTKEAPSTGGNIPATGSWKLWITNSSGGVVTSQSKDTPVFDNIDITGWAAGNYTVNVERAQSGYPASTAQFSYTPMVVVPDVITVTLG